MNLPRHAEIWFLPYLKDRVRNILRPRKPRRAWIAITDHYEPLGMGASTQTALGRVARWRDLFNVLAEIVSLGVGDVEVHLHHDHEQRDPFIRKVTEYCRRLTNDHGLLRQQDGRTVFGGSNRGNRPWPWPHARKHPHH